jgi:hypothetical protein
MELLQFAYGGVRYIRIIMVIDVYVGMMYLSFRRSRMQHFYLAYD